MSFTKPQLLLALLAALALGGCATTPDTEQEQDFEMPESVTIDLGESGADTGKDTAIPDTSVPATSVPDTAAPADPAAGSAAAAASPDAGAKPAVADADSAAVLNRLKAQQSAPALAARDPEHEKQAQKARPEFDRAVTEMRKGNLDAAQARFRELSQRYPLLAGPIVNQAIILRKKGQHDAAHSLLQNSLMTHARNPYLLNQLGMASRQLGQFKKAQVSYETAIRIDANYANAHYNLGVLADLYLHDPALALQSFNTYQSLVPEPDNKVAGWIKDLERRTGAK